MLKAVSLNRSLKQLRPQSFPFSKLEGQFTSMISLKHTVNDQLSARETYFETKAFWWALFRTGRLIGPWAFTRKSNKQTNKQINK